MIKKIVKKFFLKRERICLSQGEHILQIAGGELEYYVHSDIKAGTVVPVFFHAAIDRKKIVLPRFEGIGLCKKNMWPGISFADPVLPMNDSCSLGWFVGNDRYYLLQKEIHAFLERTSKKYNITYVFHGGSGGDMLRWCKKVFLSTGILQLSRIHRQIFLNFRVNMLLIILIHM